MTPNYPGYGEEAEKALGHVRQPATRCTPQDRSNLLEPVEPHQTRSFLAHTPPFLRVHPRGVTSEASASDGVDSERHREGGIEVKVGDNFTCSRSLCTVHNCTKRQLM